MGAPLQLGYRGATCRPHRHRRGGFGLAGFQYLRMLFGAQTSKRVVHLVRFVADSVGTTQSPGKALAILDQAAAIVGLPLREVDSAIWAEGPRGFGRAVFHATDIIRNHSSLNFGVFQTNVNVVQAARRKR